MAKAKLIFYRLRKGKTLLSFNDPIGEVPLLGEALSLHQEIAILQFGKVVDIHNIEEIKDNHYFLFDEDLYFTPNFIDEIVKISSVSNSSLQFCLALNSFNERFVLPHQKEPEENLTFNFFYLLGNQKPTAKIVEQKIFRHHILLPHQIVPGSKYSYDQCDVFITRIASPFHLLQANIALNFVRIIQVRGKFPQWIEEKFAPVHSTLYRHSLKKLNKKGKRCRIHPKAILENAVIGDDVIIGANALVRNSFIGSGTLLEDNVSVTNSVLGQKNYISNGNNITLCTTYDEVFLIHGPYQFSIFGKGSAVFAVINCDFRLDQKTILIPTDEGILDSGQTLLGIAYGHGSKVGGGNIIAAGRIIPNNKVINPPPNIIMKIDA
jgi:hypothetical protein